VFQRSFFNWGIARQKFDADKVADALRGVFGDRTLGSPDLRTGLMVISKRLDTGSPWPLTNHPKARYFAAQPGRSTVPNKDYPLWAVVRASTAAPTYFEPESILIKAADAQAGLPAVSGEFVDGGVSTTNNPSLQLVLTATVKGYGFGWEMGEDRLAVTSVGTGRANQELGLTTGAESAAALHAVKALKSVLEDCADLVEVVMQWMSRSSTAREIDRDLGTLAGCHPGGGPCLTYLRYNIHFEPKWFAANMGQSLSRAELDDLAKMDEPDNMKRLEEIGKVAAERFVSPDRFARP
jgi:hypothetical protein